MSDPCTRCGWAVNTHFTWWVDDATGQTVRRVVVVKCPECGLERVESDTATGAEETE